MISPFPGGTVVDATSRLYAAGLGDRLGQPVIVENRPGGEGVIATQAFLQLADDHKLLFSFAGPVTVNPLTIERLPYDPAHLLPISTAALDVIGIAAAPDFPAVDLRAAVALARARPGGLSWASAPGAVGLSFEAFLATERLDLARANYRSGVEAMTDLSQSRIALAVLPFGTIRPHLEAGRARLLAVTNPQRTAVAPEVATAAEQGFPNYVFEGFVGLFGPPDMPGERRLRISMTMRDIAADPALRARLEKGGQEARGSTPEEMAQRIAAQRAQVAAGLAARATR
jgi:tripartite-type tricarboxylate transporter receptor subunit TctC